MMSSQNLSQSYEGSILKMKRGDILFKTQTHEGPQACREAIEYLDNIQPPGNVEYVGGLSEAARDIVEFMGPEGARQPQADDLAAILAKHGEYEGTLSQVIAHSKEILLASFFRLSDEDSLRGRRCGYFARFVGVRWGAHETHCQAGKRFC